MSRGYGGQWSEPASIYVGNLGDRTRERDIHDAFSDFGRVTDVFMKGDFAFVRMDSERDVDRAIDALGKKGEWRVERSRRTRDRFGRGYRGSDSRMRAGYKPRRGSWRVEVSGLSPETSWQDLKDWARRECPSVVFGDVQRDRGIGLLEFEAKGDYHRALDRLDGDRLNGRTVSVRPERDERDYRDRDRGGGGGGGGGRTPSRSPSRDRGRGDRDRERRRGRDPYRERDRGYGRRSSRRSRTRSHSPSGSRSRTPLRRRSHSRGSGGGHGSDSDGGAGGGGHRRRRSDRERRSRKRDRRSPSVDRSRSPMMDDKRDRHHRDRESHRGDRGDRERERERDEDGRGAGGGGGGGRRESGPGGMNTGGGSGNGSGSGGGGTIGPDLGGHRDRDRSPRSRSSSHRSSSRGSSRGRGMIPDDRRNGGGRHPDDKENGDGQPNRGGGIVDHDDDDGHHHHRGNDGPDNPGSVSNGAPPAPDLSSDTVEKAPSTDVKGDAPESPTKSTHDEPPPRVDEK